MEAWCFGPVVLNVYYEYQYYGGLDITKLQGGVVGIISSQHQKIINEELEDYSKYRVYEMQDIIEHQTPWVHAKRKWFNNEITKEAIKQFFCCD